MDLQKKLIGSQKVINVSASKNAKLQVYKKTVLEKAKIEIDKIEEEIKQFEQAKN